MLIPVHLFWTCLLNTDHSRSVQFSSVAQLCLTLCNNTDCSTPGFPVHHQLTELTQTHVDRVGDVIQQSHPLSSLQSFPASGSFPMSHFFTSGGQSIGASASVLPMKKGYQEEYVMSLQLKHHCLNRPSPAQLKPSAPV